MEIPNPAAAQPKRPGASRYLLAILILVIGVGINIALIFNAARTISKDLQRVVVPGQHEITLNKPGQYSIYYEHESVIGNRIYSTGDSPPPLQITLTQKDSGADIPVKDASGSANYSMGAHKGTQLFEFTAPAAGTYILAATYAPGITGQDVVLAVGTGFFKPLLATICAGTSVCLGSFILAIVITVVTYRRRSVSASVNH